MDELGVCPAAIHRQAHGINNGANAGRVCWALSGTFCGGAVQGSFADKHSSCVSCEFFQRVEREQGSFFQLLLPRQEYCAMDPEQALGDHEPA